MPLYKFQSPNTGIEYDVDFENEPNEADLEEARMDLDFRERSTGQSTGEAIGSSIGRGALSVPKGIVGGLGAVGSMIPGLEDNALQRGAKSFQEDYEAALPVDPFKGEEFPVKASGAIGQAAGQLGLTVATGGLINPATARGVGLGSAALMGAEQGAETAEQYGITDPWERRALIAGGAVTEGGTEAFGGLGSKRFTESLLGRMKSATIPGSAWTRAGKTVGAEALEEPAAGQLQDWLTGVIVEEDPAKPGFATNGQPLPADTFSVQNLKNRLEEAALGAVGGTVFAGAEAMGAATDLDSALAMRIEARQAIRDLEGKGDNLTPEEATGLERLKSEDQNIGTWLERKGMDRIKPAVEAMIENPQERAEAWAKAAENRGDAQIAAFWRSEEGIAEIENSATQYQALIDNLDLVEQDAQATPEEKAQAVKAVENHTLNSLVNPLQKQKQEKAINQTVDQRLQTLKKRVEAASAPKPTPNPAVVAAKTAVTNTATAFQGLSPELDKKLANLDQKLQELAVAPPATPEPVTPPAPQTPTPATPQPTPTEPEAPSAPSKVQSPKARGKRKVRVDLVVSGREAENAKQRFSDIGGNVRVATIEELAQDETFKAFWMSSSSNPTEEGWQKYIASELPKAEGINDDGSGRPVIIPSQVAVYSTDVARAKQLGMSSGEAAALRVMLHENWHGVESWLKNSPDSEVQSLRQRYDDLMAEIPEDQMDSLAQRRYTELSNWRENEHSNRILRSEVMAERREAARVSGQLDSLVDRFMAWLRDVWMKITKSQQEPTGDELEELFQAWKRAQGTATETPPAPKAEELQLSKPIVTPEQDQIYADADAVARGDMETAQRMVDNGSGGATFPSAATALQSNEKNKNARLDTTVGDGGESASRHVSQDVGSGVQRRMGDASNEGSGAYLGAKRLVEEAAYRAGYARRAWHGTHRDFDVFDRLFASNERHGLKLDTVGLWFTDSKESAQKLYGPKAKEVFLKLQNPLVFDGVGGMKNFRDEVEQAHGSVEAFRKWAIANGHDGVEISGDYVDGELQTVSIVFDPSQIKSADPVTRDSQGNVIPLSQRFNPQSKDIRFSKPESTPEQQLQDIAKYFAYTANKVQEEGMEPTKAAKEGRVFADDDETPVEAYRYGTTVEGQAAATAEVFRILEKQSLDGMSKTLGRDILNYISKRKPLYGLPYEPILASNMAKFLMGSVRDRAQLSIDFQDLAKAQQTIGSGFGAGLQSVKGVYGQLQDIADKTNELSAKKEKEAGIDDPRKMADEIKDLAAAEIKAQVPLLTPEVRAPLMEAAQNDVDERYPMAMRFLGEENAQVYADLEGWLAEIEELLKLEAELTAGASGEVAASRPELPKNLTLAQVREMLADRRKKVENGLKTLKVVMEGADPVEQAKKTVRKRRKQAEQEKAETTDNSTFKDWVMGKESADIGTFDDEIVKYIDGNSFNRVAFSTLLSNKFKDADPNFIMGVVNRVADLLDGVATEEGIEADQKKVPNYDAMAKRIVVKSLGNKVDKKIKDPLNELTKKRLKEEIGATEFQDGVTTLGVTPDTSFALSQKVDEDIAARKAAREASKSKAEREKGQREADAEIDRMAKALEGIPDNKSAPSQFKQLVSDYKVMKLSEADLREGLTKLNIKPVTIDKLIQILSLNRQRQVLLTWNTIRQNVLKARERAINKVVKAMQPKKPQKKENISTFARLMLEASNSGILDSDAVRTAFAEAYQLHGLTTERLKEMGELLQNINKMPEGMVKETFLNEFHFLLNEVAPTASFVQFSHEALMGYILGGANTMAMQLTGIGRFINPLSGTLEMLMSGPGTQMEKIGRTIRNFFPVWFAGMNEVFNNFSQVRSGMSGLLDSNPYGVGALVSDMASVKPRAVSMAWTPAGQINKARFDAPKILEKMGLGEAFKKLTMYPAWMASRSFQVIRGFESLVAGADKNIRWRVQMAVARMKADPKLDFRDAWKQVNEAMGDKTSEMWKNAQEQAKNDVANKRISKSSEKQRVVELVQDSLEARWGSLENRHRQMAALLNYKTDPITPLGAGLYNLMNKALQSDQRVLRYSRFGFLFARFFTNAIESAWSRTPMGGLTALMLPKSKDKLDPREERIEQIFGSLSAYRDERIARAISGTATMSFLGMLMVLALLDYDPEDDEPPLFWVTGEPLGEFGKRQAMESGGWYKSQTLYLGPLRINYVNASPELAMALSAVGGLADRFMYDRLLNYKLNKQTNEYEKDDFQAYGKPVLESLAAPLSRSTFRSFYDAIDSGFNGDFKKLTRLLSNPIAGTAVALSPAAIIPSFKSLEKIERVQEQPRSPRNAAQALAASIPFTDAGEPLVTPFGEPLSPFPFFSLLSNTQEVSPERGKAARLLTELGIDHRGPETEYLGWDLSEIAYDGDSYLLDEAQRDRVLKDIGRRLASSINSEAKELRTLLKEKEGRQKVRSRVSKMASDAKAEALLRFTPKS